MDLEHHATPASKDTGESKTRFLNDNLCLLEVQNGSSTALQTPFSVHFAPGGPGHFVHGADSLTLVLSNCPSSPSLFSFVLALRVIPSFSQ